MRIDVTLPKGWHEITGEELVKLAGMFLKYDKKPEFLTRCFFLLSGWKPLRIPNFIEDDKTQYWFKSGKKKFYADIDIFHTMVKQLEWLLAGFKLPASMPTVRGYKSCNVKLYSVSLEDYLNADNLFNAFVSTNEAKYLNQLFSLFYKKKRWVAWASQPKKYAVFLWFSGAKNMLVNKYPSLFYESPGSTGTVSAEETILNLLSALNNGDVTNNEKLFKTHVHECFHELNLKIEQNNFKQST
jgi:hypothetical protein